MHTPPASRSTRSSDISKPVGPRRENRMSPTRASSKNRTQRKSADASRAPRLNVVAAVVFILIFGAGLASTAATKNPVGAISGMVLGLLLAAAPRIANQWERAVVLRLGK